MTEQSKIDKQSATRTSLFERADAAFDLGALGPASVPKNLPKAKAKKPKPKGIPPLARTSWRNKRVILRVSLRFK